MKKILLSLCAMSMLAGCGEPVKPKVVSTYKVEGNYSTTYERVLNGGPKAYGLCVSYLSKDGKPTYSRVVDLRYDVLDKDKAYVQITEMSDGSTKAEVHNLKSSYDPDKVPTLFYSR